MNPTVDIVVAVHDPLRPVLRAVESIIGSDSVNVRVTVVCHGIAAESIDGLLEREGPKVRVVEFADGVASPAGPFNRGLELATAKYVGVLGSDDFLEPGALARWVAMAEANRLDVLLAGLQHQNGQRLRNPPVRPWRRKLLDPGKDRLFHRSAPLGLIRRAVLESQEQRFEAGLVTGEDIPLSTALFAAADRIGVGFDLPRYIIGADAKDRVTGGKHSIETVLAPSWTVLNSTWFRQLSAELRTSVVTARIRNSLIADVTARRRESDWTPKGVLELSEFLRASLDQAPRSVKPFPRADRDLLDMLAAPQTTTDEARAAVIRWSEASRMNRLIPRNLLHTFGRESTPTRYLGYVLAKLGA